MSQNNFAKMFSKVPEAKEACRRGVLCDYAVFSNGCVVEIGPFHCAIDTHRFFKNNGCIHAGLRPVIPFSRAGNTVLVDLARV